MTETNIYDQLNTEGLEKVLLVGVDLTSNPDIADVKVDFDYSMEELFRLAEACQMYPVGQVIQRMDLANNAIYVGPGKLDEIRDKARETGAQLVIFNDTLTPSQLRNLQDELDLAVMDRTNLILDIFDRRARSHEAKLQVEAARLEYLRPRLIGLHDALTRQGGTSGSMSSRGAGESRLELDRRRIDQRLVELRRELKEVARDRETQAKKRRSSRLPLVSLVGYTNAGKSTIMNSFVERYCPDGEKTVFEANMLFATLDTSVRKMETGNNRDFLMSDTVGFIHKLPTGLIEAFKSTLEEVREADLLVQVVDYSDEHYLEQMASTQATLKELGAADIPMIVVYNKCDSCVPPTIYPRKGLEVRGAANVRKDTIYISAKDDSSLDMLVDMINARVYGDQVEAAFLIPYSDGAVTSYFMDNAQILETDYRPEGTWLHVRCYDGDKQKYKKYLTI